jgi:opacity protein-like surface antigen
MMTRSIIACALTLLVSGAAIAQDDVDSGGWALGIGGRYNYNETLDTDRNAHMGGAMLRARNNYFGLEGSVDYHEDELLTETDLKTWPISASILAFPLPVLYGIAGLGWYNTTVDFPENASVDDQTDSSLGYHIGGGVELPVTNVIRFTSDVRWLFVDYEFDEIPESAVNEVDADSFQFNAGILFYMQ